MNYCNAEVSHRDRERLAQRYAGETLYRNTDTRAYARESHGMAATVLEGTARKPVTRKCGDVKHDRDASPRAGIKQTCDSRERPAPFYSANDQERLQREGKA